MYSPNLSRWAFRWSASVTVAFLKPCATVLPGCLPLSAMLNMLAAHLTRYLEDHAFWAHSREEGHALGSAAV